MNKQRGDRGDRDERGSNTRYDPTEDRDSPRGERVRDDSDKSSIEDQRDLYDSNAFVSAVNSGVPLPRSDVMRPQQRKRFLDDLYNPSMVVGIKEPKDTDVYAVRSARVNIDTLRRTLSSAECMPTQNELDCFWSTLKSLDIIPDAAYQELRQHYGAISLANSERFIQAISGNNIVLRVIASRSAPSESLIGLDDFFTNILQSGQAAMCEFERFGATGGHAVIIGLDDTRTPYIFDPQPQSSRRYASAEERYEFHTGVDDVHEYFKKENASILYSLFSSNKRRIIRGSQQVVEQVAKAQGAGDEQDDHAKMDVARTPPDSPEPKVTRYLEDVEMNKFREEAAAEAAILPENLAWQKQFIAEKGQPTFNMGKKTMDKKTKKIYKKGGFKTKKSRKPKKSRKLRKSRKSRKSRVNKK